MHSTWFKSTFLGLLQFPKIKEWGPNFLGGTYSAERLNYSILPLLYFNFKSFKDPNSSSFIRFQCVLHNSDVLFSDFWNFEKLNNGDLISWGNQFCRTAELFVSPIFISILKVLTTQILYHSLGFNAFSKIQMYFSKTFEISKS